MTLQELLEHAVADAEAPGAAALVARGDDVEVASAGDVAADSIVRIASITKLVTATALMLLVDDGLVRVEDPIARWLPELAEPQVVRTPQSPPDEVVPATRPITVEDLLTSRAGWGFPDDFSLPAVHELLRRVPLFGAPTPPDEWLGTLAEVPMLRQPGEAWLYNTCSDIQGVLVSRVAGIPLPELFAERIFEPLRMDETAFHVPTSKLGRLAPQHGFDVELPQPGLWTEPPIFPSGAGGLVSTLADVHRFCRMLLADGGGLLSPSSVRLLTTDHLTPAQRDASTLFLEGAGWGFGGAVAADGRYGWIGGTGTSAHIHPATGTVAILFTQLQMTGPTSTPLMRRFWRYAFS
jgi:CubicO group peptidase (beta-lactamase class C family)